MELETKDLSMLDKQPLLCEGKDLYCRFLKTDEKYSEIA